MDLSKGSLFYYLRRTGIAKMIDNGKGVLWIRGKFKDQLPNPYFKVHFVNKTTYTVLIIFWCFYIFQLTLTSHVSNEDFQLGYSMSGHVERSFEKYISFQITHLAFVRRRDFQSIQLFVYNWFSCLFTFWFTFVFR